MGKKKLKRRIAALEGVLDSFETDLINQGNITADVLYALTCKQDFLVGIPHLNIEVPVVQLDPSLPLPEYAKDGDAGMDLRTRWDFTLKPGERLAVPAGIAIAIPEGFVGLVHPRSGLAVRHGVTVLNAPGTIDSGYRGEIVVPLHNAGDGDVTFTHGQRIAQMVFQQYSKATLKVVTELPESVRGEAGIGSTGVN